MTCIGEKFFFAVMCWAAMTKASECEHDPNGIDCGAANHDAADLLQRFRRPGVMPVAEQGELQQTNTFNCSFITEKTTMAKIASTNFSGNSPFPSFDGSQQEAYECISVAATTIPSAVGEHPTNDLRKSYAVIIGTPAAEMILFSLLDMNLMEPCVDKQDKKTGKPKRSAHKSFVLKTVTSEVRKLVAVAGWYSEFTNFIIKVIGQQEKALADAMLMLDMKSSMYVKPPSKPRQTNAIHWVNWVTDSLSLVSTMMGLSATTSKLMGFTKGQYSALISTASATIGDSANLIENYAGSDDRLYDDSPFAQDDKEQNPYKYEAAQFSAELAADMAVTNQEDLMVSALVGILVNMLKKIIGVMAGLQQVIASDAGKLYAAAEVVLSCPVSEDTGDAFIFGLYTSQLWQALAALMPSKYSVYYQRDMNAGDVPTCFPSYFATPLPTLTALDTSTIMSDSSDSNPHTGCAQSSVKWNQECGGSWTNGVTGTGGWGWGQCSSPFRRLWLAEAGLPQELAPDTFWQALGNPVTGPLPIMASQLFNASIQSGSAASFEALLGQCVNTTRIYTPEKWGQTQDPFEGPDYWTNHSGWVVASDAGVNTWLPSATGTTSTSGIECNIFGIPLMAYAIQDCQTTKGSSSSHVDDKGKDLNAWQNNPNCANGWTMPDGEAAQIASMSQYSLVPKYCVNSIQVWGASHYSPSAMGTYKRSEQPGQSHPAYTNDAGVSMEFVGSSWNIIENGFQYELGSSNTRCPPMGSSNISGSNVSTPWTVSLVEVPTPAEGREQVLACCMPWRGLNYPENCTVAVCHCASLQGFSAAELDGQPQPYSDHGDDGWTDEWYAAQPPNSPNWWGQCKKSRQYDPSSTDTSAGPLELVLAGNIDSPLPVMPTPAPTLPCPDVCETCNGVQGDGPCTEWCSDAYPAFCGSDDAYLNDGGTDCTMCA